MPIRQNILRKGKAPKQNLLGFDVFQDETGVLGDLSTSKFFKISEFPSVLPTGNSSFLIEGSDLLKPNIELKTELLDSQGNPIFHYAIPNYDKELPARRITIEIYDDDVVNGIGSFTVLGELDPTKVQIPTAFQDTYNIRFSAPVSINKGIKNIRPIRFYGDPTIEVSELVKGVIQPVYTGNQRTKTITGSVSLNIPTPTTTEYGADDSTTADSTRIDEVGNSQATYISQNAGEAQSSILGNSSIKSKPYATYIVSAMEKGVDNDDNKITSTMKGATFSITSPEGLVDSSVYPDADWTKPTTFSTKILDVINSTTFTTTTQYKIKSKKSNQELAVPLEASASNSTITHNVGNVVRTASSVFQRSFANVTVGNLRTFSGDTYKAKIYIKEDGSSGEFEKIYETLVESPNELVDQNSNTGFKSVGIFPTQSIIDNFWVSSSATFTATQDDDTIIDGVILSGSTEPNGNSFTFETSQSYSLEKNEPYLVDFDVAFKPTNKVQSDGTTKKDAKLEVFLTGTFLSETSQEVPLGEVELGEYDFNKVNTFTKVKQRQITDFLTHNVEGGVATGSLGFRLHSGEFILSDVRLRPFSETNFSPGFFKANVPMPPAIKRGQPYDFVVEFYDANNNLAEAVAVADDIVFAGPRQVLGDGADGILTGSVFLSNTEDTGIEFHGGSAYIRSIGFNGFERARAEGTSGFMMFSGSVSKSLNTSESYDGVGIEIISGSKGSAAADKFLQFRTNDGGTPAVFKVQTDDFFLGGEGQFVSGSNGNIEISSSNLHITSDGRITGSEILFSGGTITSDVNILGSVAANSILVPAEIAGAAANVGNASASIDDNGNAKFRSGSIGGFEIDDTEISSSGLVLKSNGTITGSNFLLEGGVITSDVTIQGSVAANSILTPANIGGATATVGNASASIDDNGNAVFRSGSIGGFKFTGTILTASKFELDTANEKLRLGSGNDVFIADSGDGIQLGHATFGSAPFRVDMDGALTATSATITGNLTATAGPVSSSLTSLGITTGSLIVTSSRVEISSSAAAITGSLTTLSASSAAVTGAAQQTSLNAVGGVTASLLVASESMQKQFVLVDDDTLNLQNAKGGILSSFSDYAKFFGSASNALVTSSANGTVNYTEINDKGFLVVTGSSTASFFGNTTTIGDTDSQHISIAPDSFSIKTAANVTVLSASADGIAMSGSIQAGDGTIGGFEITETQINSSNDKLILKDSGQITGSDILFSGGTITSDVTIQGTVSANSILTPATIAGSTSTSANASASIDANGNAVFRSGSIGGFSIDETTLTGTNFILDTDGKRITLGTGNNVFIADADDGIQLGHATFASAPFRVTKGGALTATSVTVTGEINANTGTTATSLTAIGVATGSLNTTTGSLLEASESMQKRFVLVNDNRLDLRNTTGGIFSSFGDYAKFFGSASNALVTSSANGTLNYTEVNDKGFLVVTGSTTASFFGNTTTIGDTTAQHISIAPDSLSIKTADDITVLSASAAGITMTGSITATEGTIGGFTLGSTSLIAGSGTTRVSLDTANGIHLGNNTFSSAPFRVTRAGALTATSVTITGEVNATSGVTADAITKVGVITGSLITSSSLASSSLESVKLTTGSLNDASSSLSVASKSMADQVILGSSAVTVQANDDNRAVLTTSGLEIFQGGTSRADFGSTTTIGNTSGQHISIDANSIDIKTAANVTALSASSAGIVMSGSINATQGNIGGFTINNQELSASGISISATDQRILVTGSNAITDGNSVIIDGGDGVIQVSQSGIGVFDSGRTEQFERNVVIEPPSFKRNFLVKENISSSLQQTDPVSTMGNAVVTESLKTKFFEVDKYVHKAAGISNTPFYYQDVANGTRLNPNARLNNGGNPTSSVFMGVSRNMTAVDTTGSLFGPEFVFSADYFTDSDIETRGLFGFVSSSATGSNIFTIATRISRSVADQDVNFGDAKFNVLGLETDTSGLTNARQNEYTFLQAKHSQSIRLQIQHDGDIVSKGNITAFGTSFLSVSDEREKEYIYQISESLNKVSKLRPTKFTWKETQKEDVGFIAQEVEKVIPEVVETTKGFINTDEDMERKTISYPKLIPYLVDTIQELTKRIEELEKKVK